MNAKEKEEAARGKRTPSSSSISFLLPSSTYEGTTVGAGGL